MGGDSSSSTTERGLWLTSLDGLHGDAIPLAPNDVHREGRECALHDVAAAVAASQGARRRGMLGGGCSQDHGTRQQHVGEVEALDVSGGDVQPELLGHGHHERDEP